MDHPTFSNWMRGRAMAAVACVALALPLAGCGSGGSSSNGASLPPIDDTRGGTVSPTRPVNAAPAQSQGMSTRKKVVLLAGAAALYYLYRKHQANKANAAQTGESVYYLSKNGRVYYRDANHQAHWVTPPTQPIAVPEDEAQTYRGLQGYNQQSTGETDLSRFAPQAAGADGM